MPQRYEVRVPVPMFPPGDDDNPVVLLGPKERMALVASPPVQLEEEDPLLGFCFKGILVESLGEDLSERVSIQVSVRSDEDPKVVPLKKEIHAEEVLCVDPVRLKEGLRAEVENLTSEKIPFVVTAIYGP